MCSSSSPDSIFVIILSTDSISKSTKSSIRRCDFITTCLNLKKSNDEIVKNGFWTNEVRLTTISLHES